MNTTNLAVPWTLPSDVEALMRKFIPQPEEEARRPAPATTSSTSSATT